MKQQKNMIINGVVLILLLLMVSLTSAQGTNEANQTGKQEQIQKKKPTKTIKPKTFIPTEKIKADTSVAFPVDI